MKNFFQIIMIIFCFIFIFISFYSQHQLTRSINQTKEAQRIAQELLHQRDSLLIQLKQK